MIVSCACNGRRFSSTWWLMYYCSSPITPHSECTKSRIKLKDMLWDHKPGPPSIWPPDNNTTVQPTRAAAAKMAIEIRPQHTMTVVYFMEVGSFCCHWRPWRCQLPCVVLFIGEVHRCTKIFWLHFTIAALWTLKWPMINWTGLPTDGIIRNERERAYGASVINQTRNAQYWP